MKKIVLWIIRIIVAVAIINLISWAVYHVHSGGKRFGRLTKPIKAFSTFPVLVSSVFQEINKPESLLYVDTSFEAVNKLESDIYILNPTFTDNNWRVRLLNLKSDSLIYEWRLSERNFQDNERTFKHARPLLPIMLDDKSLVYLNDNTHNLVKIDSASELVWRNVDFEYHHSIQLDSEGYLWACTRDKSNVRWLEDYLTKVDLETGNVIYHKSVMEILEENDLGHVIHRSGNTVSPVYNFRDPLHLNEIEPIQATSKFWKEGDLMLSLRHRSIIVQYRPSTNKVIRTIRGPFLNQHDVDVLSDSTISVFNNNVSSLGTEYNTIKQRKALPDDATINRYSEVIIYNLENATFSSVFSKRFQQNKVFTVTEGLHHFFSDGSLLVESQNEGKLYIFNRDEVLYKDYLNEPKDGLVELTHWVRAFEKEEINFLR